MATSDWELKPSTLRGVAMPTKFDKTNKGRKVELIFTDDKYTRLKTGDKGTYQMCLVQPDGRHQHCIDWDSGSKLMLIEGKDRFKFIS